MTAATISRTVGYRSAADSIRDTIVLGHGGGGLLTEQLLATAVLPKLNNAVLREQLDAAILEVGSGSRVAMTIDSFVVQPLIFPGGDIGRLAVCGTINDLAVCGAEPIGLALSLILAEGLDRSVLEQIVASVAAAARDADVAVVTGDTKVVGRGQADGMYITTAGIGRVDYESGRPPHPRNVRPGDVLIINGPIAEHGLAVMLVREMPEVTTPLRSDAAPLNHQIARLRNDLGDDVAFLRDPTRGGVAGVLADLAARTRLHVVLREDAIPITPVARHAAEMLGLDPLEVANEGKFIAAVRPGAAHRALAVLRADPTCTAASVIGEVTGRRDGLCELHTTLGGRRIVQKPYGEQLPRIC
jgi:hydrogenase expression/formation protein HypE